MIIRMFSTKLSILLIIFIGLLVYFNALFNGFILGDDFDQLLNNPLIQSEKNIPKFFLGSTYYQEQSQLAYGLYYRPLMLTVFTLTNSMFGPDPLIFHLLQILIHIINALLIYLVFKKIISEKPALVISLIFLIHPINSEAVLHISSIQEPLYLLFGMLAFYYLIKLKKINLINISILGILFLLSALAKETGLIILGIMIIYCWLFDRRKIIDLIFTSLGVILVYVGFRFGIAKINLNTESIAQIAHISLINRLINIPKIVQEYIITFIFPLNVKLAQFWMVKQIDIYNFWGPLILLVGLLSGLIIIGRKINDQHRKAGKIFLFFCSWLIIGVLPHLQIIPLDATWAERWFYLSSIGAIGIIVVVGDNWSTKTPSRLVLLTVIFLIGILSIRTIIRTGNWRDSETLFEHDIKISSENYFLQNNLGTLYINDKKYSTAKPLIEASVYIYPYFGNLNNLAIIYMKEENLDKADEYFKYALQMNANFQTYRNYANFLLYIKKDYIGAKHFTDASLKIYPKSGLLWLVLAQSEYRLGNYKEALTAAQNAYDLEPFDLSLEVMSAIKEKREIKIEQYIKND